MCSLELNHIFTYKLITEDGDDEKGLKEMLYKIQLLQLFGLNEFFPLLDSVSNSE